MKLLAAYGDKRYAYMVKMARDEGMDAWQIGMDKLGVAGARRISDDEIAEVDTVVMPNPFTKDPSEQVVELLTRLSPGTALILFPFGSVPESIRERHRLIDLGQDEGFVRANAVLTAEGAICCAMLEGEKALCECNCVIVGFGRIGYALNEMLVGLGARVTVAARRDAARRQAVQRGADAVALDEMRQALRLADVVFSTPPEMVMGESELRMINPRALVIDLASPPYGVDLEAAKALGIRAWREPGLPGRYCPESAGRALLRAVQTVQKCGGEI